MTPPVQQKRQPSVLIAGGSIAGPAVAWWLSRKYGFETTIVERSPELRKGGQNIDVRGAGREVLQMMGLEPAVLEANTTELGTAFVDSSGTYRALFPASSNGPTAELEILRGDLAEILYDATKESSKWIFGDYIISIDQDEDPDVAARDGGGAMVEFKSGKKEKFDMVIAADGVGSKTRRIVFGEEPSQKMLNLHVAYMTIPREKTDTKYAEWYAATGRKTITIRPDNKGTTRACFSFVPTEEDLAMDKELDGQIQVLRRKFLNAGWISNRLVAALDDAPDLYYERLRQIQAPHYAKGKVVLLGDAAYCASPISGMGTTLSFVGAYFLAGEIAKEYREGSRGRPEVAFAAYQSQMEPFVKKAQNLPPGAPGILHPNTWWQVAILNRVLGIVARIVAFVSWTGVEFNVNASKDVELPDYQGFYVDM